MLHTDSLQNYRESLDSHKRYIKTLQDENARLREALEFYAKLGDDIYPNTTIIYDEWGKKAREALRCDITPDKDGNK
jgi:cell shape-determining protein MreC